MNREEKREMLRRLGEVYEKSTRAVREACDMQTLDSPRKESNPVELASRTEKDEGMLPVDSHPVSPTNRMQTDVVPLANPHLPDMRGRHLPVDIAGFKLDTQAVKYTHRVISKKERADAFTDVKAMHEITKGLGERVRIDSLKLEEILVGKTFGLLYVKHRFIFDADCHPGDWREYQGRFRCDCACGAEAFVRGSDIIHGRVRSCGCLRISV